MTPDRDPFERLPHFVAPEPDPVVMNATIAQSRDAFANRKGAARRAKPSSLLDWARRSAYWLAPAGAMAVAAAVVIVLVPSLGPSPLSGSADRDLVAEGPAPVPAPSISDEAPTLSRGNGQPPGTEEDSGVTRLGVTQSPGQQQPIREPLPQVVSSYRGDNIELELRLDAEALEIYLPQISGERMLDAQNVMPGEQVEILSSAQLESGLIAIHFRVGDARFWRIYAQADGAYSRDPDLSTLVSDASDRAEVERRLSAN